MKKWHISTTLAGVFFLAMGIYKKGLGNGLPDLYLNLGSELFGIIVTVGLIDKAIERRRNQDEIRRRVLQFIHWLDHTIWVWRGRAVGLNVGERLAQLCGVKDTDPISFNTENLLLNIASEAAWDLQSENTIASNDLLREGLQELKKLLSIRDDENTRLKPTQIATCAKIAFEKFSKFLMKDTSLGIVGQPDPAQLSSPAQHMRQFGTYVPGLPLDRDGLQRMLIEMSKSCTSSPDAPGAVQGAK